MSKNGTRNMNKLSKHIARTLLTAILGCFTFVGGGSAEAKSIEQLDSLSKYFTRNERMQIELLTAIFYSPVWFEAGNLLRSRGRAEDRAKLTADSPETVQALQLLLEVEPYFYYQAAPLNNWRHSHHAPVAGKPISLLNMRQKMGMALDSLAAAKRGRVAARDQREEAQALPVREYVEISVPGGAMAFPEVRDFAIEDADAAVAQSSTVLGAAQSRVRQLKQEWAQTTNPQGELVRKINAIYLKFRGLDKGQRGRDGKVIRSPWKMLEFCLAQANKVVKKYERKKGDLEADSLPGNRQGRCGTRVAGVSGQN